VTLPILIEGSIATLETQSIAIIKKESEAAKSCDTFYVS
jgi:hypothetical protein